MNGLHCSQITKDVPEASSSSGAPAHDSFSDLSVSGSNAAADIHLLLAPERLTATAARILRLVAGQRLAILSRVDDILSDASNHSARRIEERLNESVVDYLDWLEVLRDRLRPREEGSANNAGGSLVSIIEELHSYALEGQWMGAVWFRETWPLLMRNSANRISQALYASAGYPALPGVAVCEFQLNELTETVRETLAGILASRTIDLTKNEPQEGLEWRVTPQEIHDLVRSPGTIVHTLSKDEHIGGLFILFTDFSKVSESGRDSIREFRETLLRYPGKDLWGFGVGVSQEMSALFRSHNESGYRILLRGVVESAIALGAENIVGRVRVGERGNLAMAKHEALGWKRTGIVRMKGQDPFELVYLPVKDSYERLMQVQREVPAIDQLSRYELLLRMVGDPAVIAAFERETPAEAPDAARAGALLRDFIGARRLRGFAVRELRGTLSGQKDAVIAVSDTSRQFTFFQKRRGMDEWTCFFSKDRRVLTFRDCLHEFLESVQAAPW